MAYINPEDIDKIIKSKFPNANVVIQDQGSEPEFPTVRRYTIKFDLLNTHIEFKLGYNLVLVIGGKPAKAMQNMPICMPEYAKKYIDKWLDQISKFIQPREVPKVQEIARKYLGQEANVEVKKDMVIIYYDLFFIIITPHTGSIYKNKGNRLVRFFEFDEEGSIDIFFRKASFFADSIRKGNL